MQDKHRNPDGTYDGAGVLGDLTGLGRNDIKCIWEQVQTNHARLRECQYHDFEPIPQKLGEIYERKQRYCCKHCGGEIDAHAYYWHEQGRRLVP